MNSLISLLTLSIKLPINKHEQARELLKQGKTLKQIAKLLLETRGELR